MDALGQSFFISFFILDWATCLAAWFFGIAEIIGIWRFWPWAYLWGVKVFEEELSVSSEKLFATEVIDLGSAKARSTDKDALLFRANFSLFFQTPFPIKCTLVRFGSKARIVGRFPVGSVAFIAFWLTGWTVGGLSIPMKENQSAALFIFSGWSVVLLMAAISLPIEFNRIRHARASVMEYLK